MKESANEQNEFSIQEFIGLPVIIFQINGFRFEGEIISIEKDFLKFHDTKKNYNKLIRISEISSIDEVQQQELK